MKTSIFLLLACLPCFAGNIKLEWDAPAEEGPLAYTMEATEGDGITNAVWKPIQSTANTFLEINGLKPGPWAFRVRTVTQNGLTSAPSNVVTDLVLPDAPGNLRKIVLQTSRDMQTWRTVATYDVPDADRAFYRITFED